MHFDRNKDPKESMNIGIRHGAIKVDDIQIYLSINNPITQGEEFRYAPEHEAKKRLNQIVNISYKNPCTVTQLSEIYFLGNDIHEKFKEYRINLPVLGGKKSFIKMRFIIFRIFGNPMEHLN
jgi:hypothetical protein